MAAVTEAKGETATKKTKASVGRRNQVEALVRETADLPDRAIIERPALEHFMVGYRALEREDKAAFFTQLLEKVEIKPESIDPLLLELTAAKDDPGRWPLALTKLRQTTASPRRRLFRHFLNLPGGLKFLLDFRADILGVRREAGVDLSPLDDDLVGLFESWFQDGFMFLQEISLDSPFRQIEIIKKNDMVHPMEDLEEMVRRLGRDRRCFALYHRAMPEEPVVFIEVALTRGMARVIHEILGPSADANHGEGKRDTAVFYSINNTQNGLAGLGLGKVLIFQVVDFLKREDENIRNFCTLSPLPGFWRRFLKPVLEGRSKGFKLSRQEAEKVFDKRSRALLEAEFIRQGGTKGASFGEVLLHVFSTTAWAENERLVASLAKPITHLGYVYLSEEKDPDGRPLDPVANFHLQNGAMLSPGAVNFGANWSAMGLERSLSLMVNYVYSQAWTRQFSQSMTRLATLMPALYRPFSGKKPLEGGGAVR